MSRHDDSVTLRQIDARPHHRSLLIVVLSGMAVIWSCVRPLAAGSGSDDAALREKLKRSLGSFEMREVYQPMMDNPQAAREVLRDVIRQWPDDIMAIRSLAVLEKVGEPEDAWHALPFLRSQNDILRLRALRMMTIFGDDSVLPVVEMCLSDDNSAVRAWAIKWIESRKSEAGSAALRRFLEFAPKNAEM